MPSLGYLLLFSLALALISPGLGYYLRPSCPRVPVRTNCRLVYLVPCTQSSDCSRGQSCCDTGCGLGCIGGIINFFKNLLACGAGGCGGGCSGGGCGGGCSGGRCGGGCSGGSSGGGCGKK